MSGSGISWAVCKSAPRSRQITTPTHLTTQFFTGRMPFLPPNQQRQSTEGTKHCPVRTSGSPTALRERYRDMPGHARRSLYSRRLARGQHTAIRLARQRFTCVGSSSLRIQLYTDRWRYQHTFRRSSIPQDSSLHNTHSCQCCHHVTVS